MKLTLNKKIELLRALWDDVQGELAAFEASDERVAEASDDITFAMASLPVYINE